MNEMSILGAVMLGRSIYVPDNPAYVGGSPQAVYEQLWQQGRRKRLYTRGALAAVGLVAGTWLVAPWFGILAALLVAAADALFWWRQHAATAVWRRGQRGELRTARLLRFTLQWRGYEVLHGRLTPGRAEPDHIVVGPQGVLMMTNRAWSPETEIATYGGKLYIDQRKGVPDAEPLRESAAAVSEFLSEKSGEEVVVEPVIVVHGGELRRRVIANGGITLLRPLRLLAWLHRRPERHTRAQVEAIAEAARTLPVSSRALITR